MDISQIHNGEFARLSLGSEELERIVLVLQFTMKELEGEFSTKLPMPAAPKEGEYFAGWDERKKMRLALHLFSINLHKISIPLHNPE